MFGGRLLTNHIQPLNNQNCLLAVFSNQLYIFDLNQTHIIKKITLSDNLIKSWIFLENQHKLIAIDDAGSLIQASSKSNKKNNQLWYESLTLTNKKITKGSISDAKIVITNQFQSNFIVYFVQQHSLFDYQNGIKNTVSKQCSKILFTSQTHIILSHATKLNTIKIIKISGSKANEQLLFENSSPITACAVYEENLIVGDEKGKIYQIKNYFSSQKINQQITTKYQWHVHTINALFLDQEYLYSCGQEGTIVMWHLRENKKDFLPRIGTEIVSCFVFEGIVYSLLKDNSIAAIDLSNDKLLKYYKTVINPFGFMTKSIKLNSVQGKHFSLVSSESNSRNLLASSGLPGSLQILNLNDGSNHQIQILPRNMISRIDEYYPEPHDIYDINFNKDWTLMCCSTNGINHNYLHFYKNEGYNMEYTLISRVQNPHEGLIKVLVYNNIFITYAQNEKTIRFWSRVRRAKQSIIEKQEEYFVCSGQINYRQKPIKNCNVLSEENLLLVNLEDQVIFIDLKKKSIQMAFRGKHHIEQATLVKKSKSSINVVLVSKNKITAYDLNRNMKSLTNGRTVYIFENQLDRKVQLNTSLNGNTSFLINYSSHQIVFQYDFSKNLVSNSFKNDNLNEVYILSLCYHNGKLLSFGSDSTLSNLTNSDQIVKLARKQSLSLNGMETEQDSGSHFEHQTFENIHKNYIEKQNVRKKGEISECLQKIQLQMYPSLGFSFSALCQKMFI